MPGTLRKMQQRPLQNYENKKQYADDDFRPPGAECPLKYDKRLNDAHNQNADERAGQITDAPG
jgi:phage-related minor tail protein